MRAVFKHLHDISQAVTSEYAHKYSKAIPFRIESHTPNFVSPCCFKLLFKPTFLDRNKTFVVVLFAATRESGREAGGSDRQRG